MATAVSIRETLSPFPYAGADDRRHFARKRNLLEYYGEGWNSFIASPDTSVYCNICNPFLYETAIMTDPSIRTEHLKDTVDFYHDIAQGELPAVSYVKPGGLLDGHPATSKFDLFEAFTKKIVEAVKSKPTLFAHTAIFITVDEGGGYYDSVMCSHSISSATGLAFP